MTEEFKPLTIEETNELIKQGAKLVTEWRECI